MASSLPDAPSTEVMNSIIMNYFVTEGYKSAAETLQTEAPMSAESMLSQDELDGMECRIRVRDAVVNGRVMEAIAMINDMHPQLLDDQRSILFHLQQQQLVEMIKAGRIEKAIDFAAEHLSQRALEDETTLNELERTMALLAFEDAQRSPFADLLCQSHRLKVAAEVNAALLRAQHAESAQSKLVLLIKLLLWSQNEIMTRNRLTKEQMFAPLRTKAQKAADSAAAAAKSATTSSTSPPTPLPGIIGQQANHFDIEAMMEEMISEVVAAQSSPSTSGSSVAAAAAAANAGGNRSGGSGRVKAAKSGSAAAVGQGASSSQSTPRSGGGGSGQRRTASVSN